MPVSRCGPPADAKFFSVAETRCGPFPWYRPTRWNSARRAFCSNVRTTWRADPGNLQYDVAPDGRFLMMKSLEIPTPHFDVVQNWDALVRRALER